MTPTWLTRAGSGQAREQRVRARSSATESSSPTSIRTSSRAIGSASAPARSSTANTDGRVSASAAAPCAGAASSSSHSSSIASCIGSSGADHRSATRRTLAQASFAGPASARNRASRAGSPSPAKMPCWRSTSSSVSASRHSNPARCTGGRTLATALSHGIASAADQLGRERGEHQLERVPQTQRVRRRGLRRGCGHRRRSTPPSAPSSRGRWAGLAPGLGRSGRAGPAAQNRADRSSRPEPAPYAGGP